MGKNQQVMTAARKNKNDEFYTLFHDIENECNHYKEFFRNKIVYCNCDNDSSNFFNYFVNNFNELNLKYLYATSYNDTCSILYSYNGKNNIIGKVLNGNGSFNSDECIEILKKSDVVVTNPPFSMFRDYIKLMMEYDKKFIVIGNINAIKYKEIFPYIIENKLWFGYTFNTPMIFKTPYKNEIETNRKCVLSKGYNPDYYIKVNSICWYTNVETDRCNKYLELTKQYSSEEYDKFDNFDAININNVKDIPYDYDGIMGVPITFLNKHNPNQFELIGVANHGKDNKYDLFPPKVNGKDIYTRILIKRKLIS
jgi:hypothetical protein